MKLDYEAEFRFYAELNDFLAPEQRQHALRYRFGGHPGIKDPIEVLGVPHTEVALIVVNGLAVGFDYQLRPGDRVAVYPVFKRLTLSPLPKLRENILSPPRFVLDVNLGKLAKRLRLFGFDCLYRNDYSDEAVAKISANDGRIVLTRDRRLLYAKAIEHGYWVRAVNVELQVGEVFSRFDLHGLSRPFARCLLCNGELAPVPKAEVLDRLEPKTKRYYEVFYRCRACRRIYWEGSHIADMRRRFAGLLASGAERSSG